MIGSWLQRVWRYSRDLNVLELLSGVIVTVFFAFFFYRSIRAIPFLLPVGVGFVWWNHKKRIQEKEFYFLEQFKECILSVAASLRAGYAVENAFLESMNDMRMMFGEDCEMLKQLGYLQKGLHNNETMESLLYDLARRKGNEEVLEFAEVFSIAKRSSGNVAETIVIYSNIISRKLEGSKEIRTLLAEKRLEQKIMNIMPFLIVLYLEYSNPGYFDMMFHNWWGVLLMSGCLAGYLTAYAMAEKIFVKAYS